MLQLLLFSALAFFGMLTLLKRTLTITLDTDWIYRRLGPELLSALAPAIMGADRFVRNSFLGYLRTRLRVLARALDDRGLLVGAASTGGMVIWVTMLLMLYLLVYYARHW